MMIFEEVPSSHSKTPPPPGLWAPLKGSPVLEVRRRAEDKTNGLIKHGWACSITAEQLFVAGAGEDGRWMLSVASILLLSRHHLSGYLWSPCLGGNKSLGVVGSTDSNTTGTFVAHG